jgi:ABC-type nitrate/sulfonate/bicarbonate transport system substrate-binding protein
VRFEAPNQIIDALMQDQIDFGDTSIALGITGIADYKNPGKLKIYAVSGETGENSGEDLIVPIDSDVTSIIDLKGKKFGINAGTIQWKTIAREILAQNGLDLDKDVTLVELAPSVQVQAVASKQVDALLALEPNPLIAIDKGVAKMLVKAPAKQYIADPFWYGAGVVRTNFAEKNPETTKKVIEILDKTIKEINENPDAYRTYLKGHTALTDDVAQKIHLVNFKLCEDLNEKDIDSITKFYNIFTKHKVIDGQVNIDRLLYCKQ